MPVNGPLERSLLQDISSRLRFHGPLYHSFLCSKQKNSILTTKQNKTSFGLSEQGMIKMKIFNDNDSQNFSSDFLYLQEFLNHRQL